MSLKELQEGLYDMVSIRRIEANNGKWNISQILYNGIMLGMITISIIPLMYTKEYPAFQYLEKIAIISFIVDYFLRWLVAGVKYENKWQEKQRKRGDSDHHKGIIFRILSINKNRKVWAYVRYPFTLMAIIDLLSILPGLYLINKSFVMFRFIRMLKIVRVMKFVPYFDQITLLFKVIKDERKILISVLLMSVFYIFLTALLMFNSEPHNGTNTDPHTFHCFFDALYWSTGTLTTVGAGDLGPVTEMGRIISMISSIFGVAIIAMPSGAITARYIELLREQQREKDEAEAKAKAALQPESEWETEEVNTERIPDLA